MAYLQDPRVFFATERTLLAWVRTEVALLGFTFLIKKFTMEAITGVISMASLHWIVGFLCFGTCLFSLLSVLHIYYSLNKLGPTELPTKFSKTFMMFVCITSLIMNIVISLIIITMKPL
ncbi:DUF202 domain-containing protein [Persicobacter psychrovividus]|uniref:DUF202 domain-containing protein n=1 Tax=Persicobacter psychrovividus TaxID=387638 RepID=A0ABN6LBB2_9BACT|nr:hypothetical protein PEPS_27830 [Persicobacter psychrovividus]